VINYVRGDATQPVGAGPKVICHVVNDCGAWGAGFVLAISRRWPEPEFHYREWSRSKNGSFGMGRNQVVEVDEGLYVVNMCAQRGLARLSMDGIPLDYVELQKCLREVGKFAERMGASIHMPRIGCGLARGSWRVVERIIDKVLVKKGIEVTVYDLAG